MTAMNKSQSQELAALAYYFGFSNMGAGSPEHLKMALDDAKRAMSSASLKFPRSFWERVKDELEGQVANLDGGDGFYEAVESEARDFRRDAEAELQSTDCSYTGRWVQLLKSFGYVGDSTISEKGTHYSVKQLLQSFQLSKHYAKAIQCRELVSAVESGLQLTAADILKLLEPTRRKLTNKTAL